MATLLDRLLTPKEYTLGVRVTDPEDNRIIASIEVQTLVHRSDSFISIDIERVGDSDLVTLVIKAENVEVI